MKCPVIFVNKKIKVTVWGRAVVTLFWDLSRVILGDSTLLCASCYHGMLTRLKEAVFKGSVVYAQ
jgi:hypothetical protein